MEARVRGLVSLILFVILLLAGFWFYPETQTLDTSVKPAGKDDGEPPRLTSVDTSAGCSCSSERVLDQDCCACTLTQVAEATSAYFKERLQQLVETPLFRVYAPYPDHPGEELYDVQCSIPEFRELAQELSGLQLGCAIEQCGCSKSECSAPAWRHKPCFSKCAEDDLKREKMMKDLVVTTPVSEGGSGPVQYDLIANPEQFTGYGTLLADRSAQHIWESLYTDRFCFTSCSEETEAETSPVKRLVYRVVSGLQASVNTHIAMHYGFYSDTDEPATRHNWKFSRSLHFAPWKKLFDDRVGQFPDRLRNLHFVFALMTRALSYLEPHLDRLLEAGAITCPKCAAHTDETRNLLQQLVHPSSDAPAECGAVLQAFDRAALFEEHDDESTLSDESLALQKELKRRFERMGHMMTCVGCDRCKLWGTLQFHGARVALGILLSIDSADNAGSVKSQFDVPHWTDLKPNDIVALVNALAQVSKSIDHVKQWTQDSSFASRTDL